MRQEDVFITCEELHAKQENNADVKVIDASWHMPITGRDAGKEYRDCHLPMAQFCDLDVWSQPEALYPHTVPSQQHFDEMLRTFGLHKETEIIVYEVDKLYAAPRFWFVMRAYGFCNVRILRGGLQTWKKKGLPTQQGSYHTSPLERTQSSHTLDYRMLVSKEALQALRTNDDCQLIDARPCPRFSGSQEEPRPGLKRGCIDGAINIPFLDLSDEDGPITSSELKALCKKKGLRWNLPMNVMCGSGVTACVLIALLVAAGKTDVALYDGSWSEWGVIDKPIGAP